MCWPQNCSTITTLNSYISCPLVRKWNAFIDILVVIPAGLFMKFYFFSTLLLCNLHGSLVWPAQCYSVDGYSNLNAVHVYSSSMVSGLNYIEGSVLLGKLHSWGFPRSRSGFHFLQVERLVYTNPFFGSKRWTLSQHTKKYKEYTTPHLCEAPSARCLSNLKVFSVFSLSRPDGVLLCFSEAFVFSFPIPYGALYFTSNWMEGC